MERANEQTKLIEKDIAFLQKTVEEQGKQTTIRFNAVAEDQKAQWIDIRELGRSVVALKLELKEITTKTAIYAALGATAGGALVSLVVALTAAFILQ